MYVRLPLSFGAAILATIGLYAGMQALIQTSGKVVWVAEAPKIIDPRIPEREVKEPPRKEPPVLRKSPPPPEFPKETFGPVKPGKVALLPPTLAPTTGELKPGPGFDQQAQPMVRIEPEFTNIRQAEYVAVAFDVDTNGSVIRDSIYVLDSSSKRVEKPAIRAVSRWKYRPKMVEGNAVVQTGLRVKFSIAPPE